MGLTSVISCILRKETFYLTTHPKHFIYCYMASNTWSESSQTRLTWERNNHGMIHHQRSRFQRLPVVHAHNRSLLGVQDHRVWCWGSGIPPPPAHPPPLSDEGIKCSKTTFFGILLLSRQIQISSLDTEGRKCFI